MNRAFKIIAWLTVISLFAGYGIFGLKDYLFGDTEAGIGKVNNLPISTEEFKKSYVLFSDFIKQTKAQYGEAADWVLRFNGIDTTKKTEDLILERLIQDKVLQSFADSFEMKVSKDYLDTKLQEQSFMKQFVPAEFFQNGRLNIKQLTDHLKESNIDLSEFEKQLNEVIRKTVLLKAVEGTGYIPNSVLKDEFIKKYAQRKYTIISVYLDEYLRQVKDKGVTDSELEQYFKNHQERYRVAEKRQANFWSFDPKKYGLIIEDNEINDYFNKNKDSYIKENSSKEEPAYKNLSEIRGEITEKVLAKKFTKQFGVDVNKVLIESKQSPSAFNNFLTEKKAESLPIAVLTEDNSQKSQKIFSVNKLKDKVFFVDNNKGYIGELVKIDKSYIPALKDVIEKVKQDWFKEQARELAQQTLSALALDKQKTMEEISKEAKGKLIKTDFLDPQNPEALKELKNTGVKSNMLFDLEAIGQRNVAVTDFSGLIIQLDEIVAIDQDLFEKKEAALRAHAKQSQAQRIFADLLKELKDKATIKIDNKSLAQILHYR